jgi:hypothetical protein
MNKINQLKNVRTRNAFMLIEALTVIFIFSLITVTFYSVYSVGLRYIQDAKNRLGALAVANERMEIVRNLKYDNIGTVGGTISGNIPQDQDISENTKHYHIHTQVSYVDDPFDGIGYADTAWFEDFKKVIIIVSWTGAQGTEEVELISRFVPPGKEVPHVGDGILSINIFSDQPGGTGISGARVQIANPDTGINTYEETDVTGNVTFMGSTVRDSIQKYQIIVTKSGYETVATMPPYPETPYEPIDVHASVVTGTINVKNIVQNELVNLRISSVDYLDQPISGVNFHLVGGRKLGTDMLTLPPTLVYNFNEDGVTDSDGEKLFSAISPGDYIFSLIDATLSDYEIIDTDPDTPFSLMSADETLDFEVKLASKTATALLVTVINGDGELVPGATVSLTNALGYDQQLATTSEGKAFFPVSADPFLAGEYSLKITAEGFSDSESVVTISENVLTSETKTLTALPI